MSRLTLHKQNILKTLEKLTHTSVDAANPTIRTKILDELLKRYQKRHGTQVALQNVTVLRNEWKPVKASTIGPSGMGVVMDAEDPLVQTMMIEEDLYDEAYGAVMDTFKAAVMNSKHTQEFFTHMLTDVLIAKEPHFGVRTKQND